MRTMNIDDGWRFEQGMYSGLSVTQMDKPKRIVNLPHDYMIESDVRADAPAGPASGFFTASVANYTKFLEIPSEWEGEKVFLKFDGVMMNPTVDINGCKAALWHNGYMPYTVDITPYIYYGKKNRVTVTVNPSMQPNSRWYSGAGIIRSVSLVHAPKVHIADEGIYAYTKSVDYDEEGCAETAYIKAEVTVDNHTMQNKLAMVEIYMTEDGKEEVLLTRSQKIQINPGKRETAELNFILENPKLWDVDTPNLYKIHAKVTDLGQFITHFIPAATSTVDETDILFGVRTIRADVKHGLRINGKTVKLKGGCVHHDNGLLGAVSLYDSEVRRIKTLKKVGFNAIRTTHNPPSKALMEACDRLGMYVFAEAFDAWGIMKQPGDYNMFFASDWQRDLEAFVKRDRNHPAIIIWSTGNEIYERGGLNNGYTLAKQLVDVVRGLDNSRPISNGVCSFWSGLDDELQMKGHEEFMALMNGETVDPQNSDPNKGTRDWEEMTEAFVNGLDIVGYNYMEDKYELDHEMYPDRVILGSENYPKEIGKRWPMVANTPYVIGDFTWTCYDYIGEAGIGKSVFLTEDDPDYKKGSWALMSHNSTYPWRLANDADVDINGNILPQGVYRSIVWGNERTYLLSYDPKNYGKTEFISQWGFTAAYKNWNWKEATGKPVNLIVFSRASEVEVWINGKSIGKKLAGEALGPEELPLSFVFEGIYEPGEVVAVSYKDGVEVSRDTLKTTGEVAAIRLTSDTAVLQADGHSLAYVAVELIDADGQVVPDADTTICAEVQGEAELMGFGSSAPINSENYTKNVCTTYQGRGMAIIRSGMTAGEVKLSIETGKIRNNIVLLSE